MGTPILYLLGFFSYFQQFYVCVGVYTWHSTTSEFEDMLKTDLGLLKKLKSYLDLEKINLLDVTTALEQVEPTIIKEEREFKLVSAFENDTTADEIKDEIAVFPTSKDKKAVFESLLRIQKIYKLKANDLTRGIITKNLSGHTISADDCGDIGDMACEQDLISICMAWYNETRRLIVEGFPCRYTEDIVTEEMKRVKDVMKCERLCNYNKLPAIKIDNRLKCLLWDNFREPWLLLQPAKMEYLAKKPDVVRFHNAISDKEIENLKNLAKHNMASAKTRHTRDNATHPKSNRISHNSWLYDGNSKLAKRITHRIHQLTGLDMSNAEPLQVATYGIGGHYIPHYDWYKMNSDEELNYKNRKATFMFYLSDVEFGGATVFLYPGVTVQPIKGSALFWYDLRNTGDVDKRTRHCACNVVVGSKWVANKWIRETSKEMCKIKEYIGRMV